MTNPLMRTLTPGHGDALSNTDVQCPKDRELVNVECWMCGWVRDSDERKMTLLGLSEPIWHRAAAKQGLLGE